VNSESSAFRQRFTLAHELAHLILGTQPDVASEPFCSISHGERDADRLASEFLIPDDQLTRHLRSELPVHAKTLERLAKAANVSPVVAACRVVGATDTLGLHNAAVVFFVHGKERWRYSYGLQFDEAEAEELLTQALANKPNIVRNENRDGNIVVGSIIDAQIYQVLLIQLLPQATATLQSREERLQTLVDHLFGDDHSFQQSVAAIMGFVKQKCQGQGLEQAIRFFEEKYVGKRYVGIREQKLRSKGGREYVRACLERWFN
jgi:hypothetical protein